MKIESTNGQDLSHYYKRMIEKCPWYKFVKVSPNESWGGNWIVDGEPCFLVTARQSRPAKDGNFYIWCCGNDDTYCVIRDLDRATTQKMFDNILEKTSQKDLEAQGLIFGG